MKRVGLLCAIGLGVVGTGLSLAVTLPLLDVAHAAPLMQIWPAGANNRAQTAAELITVDADQQRIAQAVALASDVLAEEPTNVVAARTLGLAAALRGEAARASRIMAFAETLSRRDKQTQIFLIEDSVGRGDVAGALVHYDRVLRNSPEIRAVLLPVLRGAASDPNVGPPLARLVASKPLWWGWFINSLVDDPADSSGFLYRVAILMRPNLGVPIERDFLRDTIGRLIATGRQAQALQLYAVATGSRAAARVRDGGFERSPVLPPLDWQLTDQDGFGATRENGDDGTTVLKLIPSVSQGGRAARQAIVLSPGTYRITLRAGGIDPVRGVRPTLRIACVADDRELLTFELTAPGAARALASPPFTVPTGCTGQWLDVDLSASEPVLGDDFAPWIDNIAVVPAG